MNITDTGAKTEHKILSITKCKSDIIFLSDTRLNTDKQKSAVENVTKKLDFIGYDFYHNSRDSLRGTAILIKKKLNHSLIGEEHCVYGNFLLLKIKISDYSMVIGSIYGPNTNENIGILDNLQLKLNSLKENCNIILGGDWNCTWDTSDAINNIDVLNMAAIPSRRRSEKLKEICNLNKLTDPFRTLYPNKNEYSYIPAVRELTNRSRLDFFLISDTLINKVTECEIAPSLSSVVFDHKKIHLTF